MTASFRIQAARAIVFFVASTSSCSAAVIATVEVDSPHLVRVTLEGPLEGSARGNLFNRVITLALRSQQYSDYPVRPSHVVGGYNVGVPSGILYNTIHSSFLGHISMVESPESALISGYNVRGTATFEYSNGHGLSPGQPFDIYWGTANPSFGGVLQSSGFIGGVPEPSAFVISVLTVASSRFCLRRRSRS